MIEVTMTIRRPVNVVWDYFTNTDNWNKWNVGVLKEVVPGWTKDAKLIWALGGTTTVSNISPYTEIYTTGAWFNYTYKFIKKDSTTTIVKIIESDPKGGASFNDGGAGNKAALETRIYKLKEGIERETEHSASNEQEKKWWKFWK